MFDNRMPHRWLALLGVFAVLVSGLSMSETLINATPAKAAVLVPLVVVDSALGEKPQDPCCSVRQVSIVAKNQSVDTLTNVQAVVSYYDAANKLLSTKNTFGDTLLRTAPGELVGVFDFPPTTAVSYTVDLVAGYPTDVLVNRNFRVSEANWIGIDTGYKFLSATVTNLNSWPVESPQVQVICHNVSGVFVGWLESPAASPPMMQPGDSALVNEIFTNERACLDAPLLTADDLTPPGHVIALPAAPAPPQVVVGAGSAAVSWQPPTDTGGAPVSAYTVSSVPTGGSCTTHATGALPPGLSCTVTGLSNGMSYSFAVAATTAAGLGPWSPPSAMVVPSTHPSAARAVSVVPGNASAVVRWAAPASNGGSTVNLYLVTSAPASSGCVVVGLACRVTALRNGVRYRFFVSAANAKGKGPRAVSPVVVPSTVPGAVRALRVALGHKTARVTWSAVTVTGGASVNGYVWRVSLTGGRTWRAWSHVQVARFVLLKQLTVGGLFRLQVRPRNLRGVGTVSSIAFRAKK
jgi:hypothetical protein